MGIFLNNTVMRKFYFYLVAFVLMGMAAQATAQPIDTKSRKRLLELRKVGVLKTDSKASINFGHKQKRINKHVMKVNSDKVIWGYQSSDASEDYEMGIGTFKLSNPTVFTVTFPAELDISAGACYNDIMYMQEAAFGKPIALYSIDLITGEEKKIADCKETDPLIRDMTYDYITNTMYGVGGTSNGETSCMYSINLETGDITELFPIEYDLVTLAADSEGNLFGISAEGDFCWVFPDEEWVEYVGHTNEFPTYLQSMDFDRSDNTLYWAGFTEEGSFLATINLETGEATRLSTPLGNDAEILALYVPSNTQSPAAPNVVTDLVLKPGEQGALTTELSWKNPSITIGGDPVGTLTKVEVYRNEELVYTKDAPIAGETEQWTDNVPESGFIVYKLIASNKEDEGKPAKSEQIFVGKDVPDAVGNLQFIKEEGNYHTRITWEAPAKSMNGGWFDATGLKYDVVRYPDTVMIARDLTETNCKDEAITALNAYYYEVIPKTADGNGVPALTDKLFVGPAMELPYYCDFSTEKARAPWIVEDTNQDGYTWMFDHNYRATKDWFLAYDIYAYEKIPFVQANDWFFSAPFKVEKEKKYTLKFYVRLGGMLAQEKFKAVLSNGASSKAQMQVIGDYPDLNSQEQDFMPVTAVFTASETGEFNLGFQCYSDPNQWYLQITDILLEASFDKDMEAVVIKGMAAPVQNETTPYDVTIKNNGAENVSAYRVEVIDGKQNVVGSREINRELIPQQELMVEINCKLPETGKTELKGRVILEGEENENNNVTPALNVEAWSEKDLSWVYVGNKEMNYWPTYPFDVERRYNYIQTLYLPGELNITSGKIKGLAYYYFIEPDNLIMSKRVPKYMQVKISLANTETPSLAEGYMPAEQFIKVYEGSISLDSLNNVLTIMLDSPFEYTGKNLCVLTERTEEDGEEFKRVYFMYTADTDILGEGRTMYYASQNIPFGPDSEGFKRDHYPDVSLLIDESGTSIEKVEADSRIIIYPNPVQDKFYIQGEYVSAELFSANGNLMQVLQGKKYVDMSGYAKGIYFLKVQTDTTAEVVKILLK